MRICRLAAAVVAVLLTVSLSVPAYAQDANEHNILYGASITYVGLDAPHTRGGVYQDIAHLVDNEWAIGPKSEHGNYNAKIVNWTKNRYNVDGALEKNGDYVAILTFELAEAATAAGFRLIHPDVTGASGVDDPLDFVLSNFDVLGSETGEAGTWKVLYEARDLRVGSDVEYMYYESETAVGIPYWSFDAKFAAEMNVSYVALAIHKLNVEKNSLGTYMNLHEFQIFSPAQYAENVPAETNTPQTIQPTRDPITVEDFIPKTTFGWVAVSAVLATGCSVGCMAWTNRKEKASE